LRKQEQELKGSLEITQKSFKKAINESRLQLTNTITEIRSQFTDLMKNLSNEARKDFEKFMREELEDMRVVSFNLDQKISDIAKNYEQYGTLKIHEIFLKLLDSRGEPLEVYPVLIKLLESLKTWYSKQTKHSIGLLHIVDSLLRDLRTELYGIYKK